MKIGYFEEVSSKQKQLLESYPIQIGDIVLTPDKKIVKINVVQIRNKAIVFLYSVMNSNLDFGKRRGELKVEEELVLKKLSSQQYQEYREKFNWRSRQQVINMFIKTEKKLKISKIVR
ncbi:hypothetical protein HUW51_07135 [Adhaeribacter swui]|uniref:Uncharacterized protein n=1 Tax=Adhaeribacter swui TaxID=2086471 RepID=A0A7G7G5S5_9BACT|nr:hypothetical protein [Adhaeribacter swui]QNF32509.1 hypothetical protein HUW51_07135 [Adhaeribacter swui]